MAEVKKRSIFDDLAEAPLNTSAFPPAPPAGEPLKYPDSEVMPPELEEIRGTAKPAPIPSAARVNKPADVKAAIEAKVADTKKTIAERDTPTLDHKVRANMETAKASVDPADKRDLAWLEKKYEDLNQEYKDSKDSIEWRAALETVANSLTQLAAARAGLREGVDMSGMKFSKTDFDKQLEGVQADIARRKGQAENIFGAAEKQKAEATAQGFKERELTVQEGEAAEKARANKAGEALQGKKMSMEERIANQDILNKNQQAMLKQMAESKDKQTQLTVPGFGIARGVPEAEKFRATAVAASSAKDILHQIKDLGKDVSVLTPVTRGQVQTLVNMAVGKLREILTGPGSMSETDRAAIIDTIGNPAAWNKLEAVEMAKLDTVINTIDSSLQDTASQVIVDYERPGKDKVGANNTKSAGNEIKRRDKKTGKTAIFDSNKQFLRYEE